jgi:mannose-6-phosphate isomerase-like protein (cupin superfamily)
MQTLRRTVALAGGAALALAALSVAHAQAQAPDMKAAAYLSAADMARMEAKTLGTAATWSYQTIVRDPATKYEVEVHDARNDVIMVQEGRGNAELGGVVTGNRVTAPNEHRGGTVAGSHNQALGPGDVLFIPAGMPHVLTPTKDSPHLRYLVVKTQP